MKRIMFLCIVMISCAAFGGGKLFIYPTGTSVPISFGGSNGDTIQYPTFVIPLNGWSEVELKASEDS